MIGFLHANTSSINLRDIISNIVFLHQIDLLEPKGRKLMSSCFDGPEHVGWGATCDPESKKGQRGYCGPGETSEEEGSIIYPNSTNWGWCDNNCVTGGRGNNILQACLQLKPVNHQAKLNTLLFFSIHPGIQVRFDSWE